MKTANFLSNSYRNMASIIKNICSQDLMSFQAIQHHNTDCSKVVGVSVSVDYIFTNKAEVLHIYTFVYILYSLENVVNIRTVSRYITIDGKMYCLTVAVFSQVTNKISNYYILSLYCDYIKLNGM